MNTLKIKVLLIVFLFTMSCSESNTNVDETVNLPQVVIGNQIWMKENLNASAYRNGDPIRYAGNYEEWKIAQQKALGAWCYYDFDPKNGEIYGKLYNWIAVNDSRGLAPSGYHVPSDSDWERLVNFLGGDSLAGNKMKSKTGWYQNGNGDNSSGYNGLPGGYCEFDGNFKNLSEAGAWWSSSEEDMDFARFRALITDSTRAFKASIYKLSGLSVRCIKD